MGSGGVAKYVGRRSWSSIYQESRRSVYQGSAIRVDFVVFTGDFGGMHRASAGESGEARSRVEISVGSV